MHLNCGEEGNQSINDADADADADLNLLSKVNVLENTLTLAKKLLQEVSNVWLETGVIGICVQTIFSKLFPS